MALTVINAAAAAADTADDDDDNGDIDDDEEKEKADDDNITQSINVFLFAMCQSDIRYNKNEKW